MRFGPAQTLPPAPPMAWHRLPATPTRVPHRAGRSRVEPRPHDPRAQSPRPVWVCGAFSPFVPLYIGGEVLNFAHVHTRARMLLTVPDSAGSHPTSGPGSVRQFTQHGAPHLTVTLVTDVPLWWQFSGGTCVALNLYPRVQVTCITPVIQTASPRGIGGSRG